MSRKVIIDAMNTHTKVQYRYKGSGGLFSPLLIGLTSKGKEVMFGYSNTRRTYMMLPLRHLTTKETNQPYEPRQLQYNSGTRGKIIKHVYAKPSRQVAKQDKRGRQKGLQQAQSRRAKLFSRITKLFK